RLRRASRPSLFPYTTLFRSADPVPDVSDVASVIAKQIDERARVRDNATPELARIRKRLREQQARLRSLSEQIFSKAVAEKWVPEDRKSTRLNSSHVKISYAV